MPIYYKEEELKDILSIKEEESKVFIPNEIFKDLTKNIDCSDNGKSSKHIAFAFSYHYLIMYLWRYAKLGGDFEFTEEELKKICNVSPHSKGKEGVTYITKKDGLLDQLGYIEKVSNYPIWQFWLKDHNEVNFGMSADYKEADPLFRNVRNRKANEPLKLTSQRIYEMAGEEYESPGILFDISNTTEIPINIFIYCVSRKELGCEGFYLYCFLKYMNDKFRNGWSCPLEKIPNEVGMKRDVIKDRLKALEEYNMIRNNHVPFVPYLQNHTSDRIKANTYKINNFNKFVKKGEPKLSIDRRVVMSYSTYKEKYDTVKIEIEIDGELPFE